MPKCFCLWLLKVLTIPNYINPLLNSFSFFFFKLESHVQPRLAPSPLLSLPSPRTGIPGTQIHARLLLNLQYFTFNHVLITSSFTKRVLYWFCSTVPRALPNCPFHLTHLHVQFTYYKQIKHQAAKCGEK